MTSEPTLLQLPRIEARDNPLPLIPELFERQVRATPEAIAISFEERQLTYEQLNRRANQLAHALRRRGVGPEVPVALYLERSIDMVIAIIAVLKAGGAYVPIDLAYPPDRAAFMLADAQAPVLLTQQKLLPSLPPQAITTLCLDSEWETSPVNPRMILSAVRLRRTWLTSSTRPVRPGSPRAWLLRIAMWFDY